MHLNATWLPGVRSRWEGMLMNERTLRCWRWRTDWMSQWGRVSNRPITWPKFKIRVSDPFYSRPAGYFLKELEAAVVERGSACKGSRWRRWVLSAEWPWTPCWSRWFVLSPLDQRVALPGGILSLCELHSGYEIKKMSRESPTDWGWAVSGLHGSCDSDVSKSVLKASLFSHRVANRGTSPGSEASDFQV